MTFLEFFVHIVHQFFQRLYKCRLITVILLKCIDCHCQDIFQCLAVDSKLIHRLLREDQFFLMHLFHCQQYIHRQIRDTLNISQRMKHQ